MTITPAWTIYESPLGALTVVTGSGGIRSIYFPGRSPRLDEAARRPLTDTVEQLEQYFAGERTDFELRLDLDATVASLGDRVSEARDAVQPGRRIATLGRSAGLALPVALITPKPERPG